MSSRPANMGSYVAVSAHSDARLWGPALLCAVLGTFAVGNGTGFDWSIKVLALVGFGACLAGLRRPGLGLLGMGMLCTLEPVARGLVLHGGLWRWNTLSYWLLLVLVLFSPGVSKLRNLQLQCFIGFLMLLVIELLVTPDLLYGVQQLLDCTVLLGLFVCFVRVNNDSDSWYWMGILAGILSAVGSALFYSQMDRLPYVNENTLAYFPLTGIFAVCLAFPFVSGNSRRQLILAGLAVVNGIWVFLSGSRGGLLTGMTCLLVLMLELRSPTRSLGLLLGSLILASVLASQFPTHQNRAVQKIRVLFDSSQSLERRTSGRSDLVAGAWQIFRENPLGVGTGGFAASWAKLDSVEGQREFYHSGEQAPAHTGWMKVLAENGFPGFLMLAGFVSSFAIAGWRQRRQRMMWLGLMVTLAMSVGYISSELSQKGLLFLAAGVMAQFQLKAQARAALERAPYLVGTPSRFDASLGWTSMKAPD